MGTPRPLAEPARAANGHAPPGAADTSGRRSAQELGALLAGYRDGGFAVGAEGDIVLWNLGAQRILGYAARDVVGKQCRDVLPGLCGSAGGSCESSCHIAARAAAPVSRLSGFDAEALTKSGDSVWLSVHVVPATGPDGEGVTAHLFRDATDVYRAARTIRGTGSAVRPPLDAPSALTRREIEILRCMALGENSRAIAERLAMSRNTVRTHVANIFKKMGVHSRLQAVARAHRHDIVQSPRPGA